MKDLSMSPTCEEIFKICGLVPLKTLDCNFNQSIINVFTDSESDCGPRI